MNPMELLRLTSARLDAQRATKELYAERLAPDFSVFDFLNTRENGLSRVIAWLLDPNGSHAQGARFLVAFMKWLGFGEDWTVAASRARTWTEVSTGTGSQLGYIDILVRCGERALAIENKPYAEDQPRQLERYLDYLAHNCRVGHRLLYLSGSGNGPSVDSIQPSRAEDEIASGTLIVRGYASLIDWLEACLPLCRAPNVAFAIDGLAKHVRSEFMGIGDIDEAADLARAVCENMDSVDAALALIEAEQPIRKIILKRFDKAVRERIADRGWHVIRNDLGPGRHSGYLLGFAPKSTIGFGFQFDQSQYGWLFYGVASEEAGPLPQGAKQVLKPYLSSEASTDYWPVWRAVGPNDRHFPLARQADREFWRAAYDGHLAEMLISFVGEAEAVLKNAGLLDAVRER